LNSVLVTENNILKHIGLSAVSQVLQPLTPSAARVQCRVMFSDLHIQRPGDPTWPSADDFRKKRRDERRERYVKYERAKLAERARPPSWLSPKAIGNFEIFREAWGSRRRNRKHAIPEKTRRVVCRKYRITCSQLKAIVRKQVQWDVLLETDWALANAWLRRHTRPVSLSTERGPIWARVEDSPAKWRRALGQLERTRAPKTPARKTPPGLAARVCDLARQEPRPSCREIARRLRQMDIVVGSATVNRILRRPFAYYPVDAEVDDKLDECRKKANERFTDGWRGRRLT
jgi:hypothetical protein